MSNNPYDSPAGASPPAGSYDPSGNLRSVCVRRFDPLSVGKIAAALYAVIGLIVGGVMFVISLIGLLAGGANAGFGLIGGVAVLVFAPVFYAVMGFIFAMLGAVVYNVVAGMVGGIRMDLEL